MKIEPNPTDLVESFATSKERFQVYSNLRDIGIDALSAIRQGLQHDNWHVRHWCAICLDGQCDKESLQSLIPLLTDPVSKVRLWAVHSICCEHNKDFENPINVIPLLINRINKDENLRVRKMAVTMLAKLPLDLRVVPVLKTVLDREQDAKIRLHAERALDKYHKAGMAD